MPRMRLLCVLCAFVVPAVAQFLPATQLRCEYLTNPLGIDVAQPRFSWALEHTERGQVQTAYQLRVVKASGAVAWDSGRVESGETTQIVYRGEPLVSGQRYQWSVTSWDKQGRPNPTPSAWFEMGLLAKSEWKGRWIGGGNVLRKPFILPAAPVRARAYISGIGYSELRINGRKSGDHVLDPGWTTYGKRVLYVTHDVTSMLRKGPNAVGVMLGQGWYEKRAVLLQLNIEMEGGQRVEIVSDATWKAADGPITADSVFDGETYDARLETPGWDLPLDPEPAWKAAAVVDGPAGELSAQMMPPIRMVERLPALKMTSPRPGVYIYDLGQNFSGFVRLRVRGPRGTAVRLRHAELLYEDGTLNVENLRRARATDVYILRGGDLEVHEPRFTYHGFRYVELTGYPGTPRQDTIEGIVVHTDVKPVGGFASSNKLLNRLQHNILWGLRSNLHSIPTDCNQRDERMGWMADAHLAAEVAIWNFDMAAFYSNFLRDIRDVQGADGTVTDTVPHKWGSRPADPAWGSAYPLFVWYLYQYYGDRRALEDHYAGIKAWADYLHSRSEDGVLNYASYGDWVSIEDTPKPVVSTFYYFWSTDIVAKVAEILGKKEDATAYAQRAGGIREASYRKFQGVGTQTALTLAAYLGLAPQDRIGGIIGRLRNSILYQHNTHLTTGIVGTKYLMPLLTRTGHGDLAYELATQTTFPSWGYMIENGATTMWELWQNKTGPSMNSHNHPMFGSVGAWFYEALAGIQMDPAHPGFAKLVIRPQMVRDLRWASATTETLRGTLSSSWSRTDESLRLDVVIPVGSTAEVHVPKLTGGKLISDTPAARETNSAYVVAVGSGRYTFEVK